MGDNLSPNFTTYGISQRTGLMDAFTVVTQQEELRTNTAALADSTQLLYPIGPQETIAWRMVLFFGGNSPGDVQLGFFTPAAPVSGGFIGLGTAAGGAALIVAGVLATYNAAALLQENSTGAGNEFAATFDGHLVNGANGGYFRLQWAQNVVNATPSRLLIGSRMDVWKVG